MAPKRNEISEAYRKAKDGTEFLRKGAAELVEARAAEIAGTGSVREKLGLVAPEKMRSASFTWECPARFPRMVIIRDFEGFFKKLGSKKPDFDAALLVKRISDLAPSFDPNRPGGTKIVIHEGKISLYQKGKEIFAGQDIIEEQGAERRRDEGGEQVKEEAQEERGKLRGKFKLRKKPETPPPSRETVPEFPKERYRDGIWTLSYRGTRTLTLGDEYGETVYHFLKGTVEKNNLLPEGLPFEHELSFLNALIALMRDLNKDKNLDNFDSLLGKSLVFPDKLIFAATPNKPAKLYEEMQAYAAVDGFPVTDPHLRNDIAKSAKERPDGVILPLEGDGFFRKNGEENGSERRTAPDVYARFLALARDFKKETDGYSFSYTDVIRDTDQQGKTRGGTKKGSTHLTGRSIDFSSGRFKTPDGDEITWSDDSSQRVHIEAVLRPKMTELLIRHGFAVFDEHNHWHTYVPAINELSFHEERVPRFAAAAPAEPSVPLPRVTEPERPAPSADVLFPTMQEWSYKKAMDAHAGFMKKYGHYFDDAPSFYSRLLTMASTDISDIKPEYLRLNLDRIQAKIDELTVKGRDEFQGEINDLVRLRTWKAYAAYVDMLAFFPARALEELGVIQGSVLHSRVGGENYRTDRLEDAWRVKKKKRGSSAVNGHCTYLDGELRSLDGRFSIHEWEAEYKKAESFLKKNLDKLGFGFEMARYVDKRVFLGVMHAEFFSEMNSDMYLRILPTAFQQYNMMYAPAMYDREFSGGLVQMTSGTMDLLLKQYGATVRAEGGDRAGIKVPDMATRKAVVDAMFLDKRQAVFWQQLVVLDHIKEASLRLESNAVFKGAWDKASDAQRRIFVASLSAMAINAGQNGAKKIADELLRQGCRTMQEFIDALPLSARRTYYRQAVKAKTTSRNAQRGAATMRMLLERA